MLDNVQLPNSRTILIADNASFHKSKKIREFHRVYRKELKMFFLPKYSPKLNPDEQVWGEIKDHKLGRQPIKNKLDLKNRLFTALWSLQKNTLRVISFFELPDLLYSAMYEVQIPELYHLILFLPGEYVRWQVNKIQVNDSHVLLKVSGVDFVLVALFNNERQKDSSPEHVKRVIIVKPDRHGCVRRLAAF